ncbi:MAG: PcfJ domain-containing protein [Hyphomicrobiaceae bacterium]|nr:PcfJ domain-containing protein [Hyphomicrobiaceae bacterium]
MMTRVERMTEIERQIARFDRSTRRRLRQLAGLSPRLADLLVSFPAVAFAIVTGSAQPDALGRAIRLVRQGAALREVADSIGLPMWTRRLPPEAFIVPLVGLPASAQFAARIANVVPQKVTLAPGWLAWVAEANRMSDETLALWIARQPVAHWNPRARPVPALPLTAYAWYSRHGDGTMAGRLIGRPFDPKMAFREAAREAHAFVEAVLAKFRPQAKRRGPGRYSRQPIAGLRIVRVSTGPQLIEEGQIMRHCVGTYVDTVARGECMIFSIRDGANRVATLELRRRGGSASGQLALVQLQGPANARVAPPVRDFVGRWLAHEAERQIADGTDMDEELVFKPELWAEVWRPYALAKAPMGLAPGRASLMKLRADAETLLPIR